MKIEHEAKISLTINQIGYLKCPHCSQNIKMFLKDEHKSYKAEAEYWEKRCNELIERVIGLKSL